jgi:hypothetical protein
VTKWVVMYFCCCMQCNWFGALLIYITIINGLKNEQTNRMIWGLCGELGSTSVPMD